MPKPDFTTFDDLFSAPEVAAGLRRDAPGSLDAASNFWRSALGNPHLSARMKELLLLAMHASATALHAEAIRRHVARALAAGASREDIVDVLTTIANLANHGLYSSVPVLEEELRAAGRRDASPAELDEALQKAKDKFVKVRGFWNSDRDPIARQMPEYFLALTELSTQSWEYGSLSRKEREFLCIAIDCNVTHSYPPGLRIHIRNAIALGASRDEILAIFQLAAMMGLEGYLTAAEALCASPR